MQDEEKVISIDLKKKNGYIILKVSDNGNGIPDKNIKKIFEPFFTSKKAHEGMGLGLSTTREIVEKEYRGTIGVETTEGKGTTFIITIPLQHEEHSAPPSD